MKAARHFTVTGYVVRGGKTLLLHHKKLRMWLAPGGHLEEGELPEEALVREIREETGLEVEILSPKASPGPVETGVRYLHVPSHVQLEDIPNHPQHIDLVYYCLAKDGEAAFSALEHEGMRWHSPEDLARSHVRDEVRQRALEAIALAESRAPQ
ncbi:MAG: NUDIX domain-containing protein [Elusimicrobia bacterium]|nr:NUDIX domain-containing protein [Elusimicrobiota bacterium]